MLGGYLFFNNLWFWFFKRFGNQRTSGSSYLKISRIKEPWGLGFFKKPQRTGSFHEWLAKNWQFYSRLFYWFFDLFRIAVIYQSQLQIFENHGYVSELVIWFSWRTALRTSSYQFHFGHLPNGGLFALYIRISLRTEFSVKPENWPSPSLPCFVDCVNICGHQNSLEQ